MVRGTEVERRSVGSGRERDGRAQAWVHQECRRRGREVLWGLGERRLRGSHVGLRDVRGGNDAIRETHGSQLPFHFRRWH